MSARTSVITARCVAARSIGWRGAPGDGAACRWDLPDTDRRATRAGRCHRRHADDTDSTTISARTRSPPAKITRLSVQTSSGLRIADRGRIAGTCGPTAAGAGQPVRLRLIEALTAGPSLTATPKRDETADTYAYFGDPAFAYSLAQGIEDGFLAPYRVRRVVSADAHGWRLTRASSICSVRRFRRGCTPRANSRGWSRCSRAPRPPHAVPSARRTRWTCSPPSRWFIVDSTRRSSHPPHPPTPHLPHPGLEEATRLGNHAISARRSRGSWARR
jgi:hypothetical protein